MVPSYKNGDIAMGALNECDNRKKEEFGFICVYYHLSSYSYIYQAIVQWFLNILNRLKKTLCFKYICR